MSQVTGVRIRKHGSFRYGSCEDLSLAFSKTLEEIQWEAKERDKARAAAHFPRRCQGLAKDLGVLAVAKAG